MTGHTPRKLPSFNAISRIIAVRFRIPYSRLNTIPRDIPNVKHIFRKNHKDCYFFSLNTEKQYFPTDIFSPRYTFLLHAHISWNFARIKFILVNFQSKCFSVMIVLHTNREGTRPSLQYIYFFNSQRLIWLAFSYSFR